MNIVPIAILQFWNYLLNCLLTTIALPPSEQTWPSATDALVSGWGILISEESSALVIYLQVQLVRQDICLTDYT